MQQRSRRQTDVWARWSYGSNWSTSRPEYRIFGTTSTLSCRSVYILWRRKLITMGRWNSAGTLLMRFCLHYVPFFPYYHKTSVNIFLHVRFEDLIPVKLTLLLFWVVTPCRLADRDQGCRLGGIVISVLATGPTGRGFKPGRGDRFFKGNKNPLHTFLRMGSKARGPM
jgi:hypothetical protein